MALFRLDDFDTNFHQYIGEYNIKNSIDDGQIQHTRG